MENRVIKFRAWNSEQMISPDYIDRRGFAHWKENSIPQYTDKVMQFTGLVDRNGEELFESDIVLVKGTKKVGTYKTFIKWSGQGFMLNENKTYYNDDSCFVAVLSVLGNIHETPRLLK